MAELARRLDAPGTYSTDPEEVFDELRRASAGGIADYSGIDYALLDAGVAAHWPYPAGSTGSPRLFAERFAHDDGRARIVAVAPAAARRSAPVRRRARPSSPAACSSTTRAAPRPGGCPSSRRPSPRCASACTPRRRRPSASLDGDMLDLDNARGTMRGRAILSTRPAAGHGVRAVPLRRRRRANLLTVGPRGSRLGHAGVQDRRRCACAAPRRS